MQTIEDKTRIKVTSSLAASVAPVVPAIKKEQTQTKTVTELNNTVQRPLPVGPAPRPVQEAQMAKVGIPAWRAV